MILSATNRLFLAIQLGAILFVCSASFGVFQTSRLAPANRLAYAFVLGIPASATLLFILLATVIPGILAVGGIKFPLNVTLPVLFAALTLASVVLWTTPNLALINQFEIQTYGLIWKQPLQLGVAALAQMGILTFLTAVREDPNPNR